MLSLCNVHRSWRKVTSHDIRLKVPTKQSCQQNDQEREKEREGEGRDGRKVRGGQHRYFVSLPFYHLLPLPPLLQTFSELTPRVLVPSRKSPPLRRRTRIKDSFEVIGRRYFLPFSRFSYSVRNATSSVGG